MKVRSVDEIPLGARRCSFGLISTCPSPRAARWRKIIAFEPCFPPSGTSWSREGARLWPPTWVGQREARFLHGP